jgi:hypothetical protein
MLMDGVALALLMASLVKVQKLFDGLSAKQLDGMKERGRQDAASSAPSLAVRCQVADAKER